MKPIGYLSYLRSLSVFPVALLFVYIGVEVARSGHIPHGELRHFDPQIWGPLCAVMFAVIGIFSIPLVVLCLFRRGLGLWVKGGRLVYPLRLSSVRLDQIASVAAVTEGAFWTKPNTIKLGLSNGRTWKINAIPFKTSIGEMISSIEAQAPGLAKRPDSEA